VQTIDELIGDPQFAAGGGLVEVPDEAGALTMLATPADFRERPAGPRFRAPRLGEHTLEVLGELGYRPSLITNLQEAEAVYTEDTAHGPD
jgi:crotonobetainyl-CoA:carnitine CoA-transferase CaiB-like acyl-CoA transferase